MTCNGCRSHVENTLDKVEGVSKTSVNLEKGKAEIEMDKHIPLTVFEKALKDYGGSYSISLPEDAEAEKTSKNNRTKENDFKKWFNYIIYAIIAIIVIVAFVLQLTGY